MNSNSDPSASPDLPLAIVLVSGGMDSAVLVAEIARTHRLALLHADYGQKTEARERRAFNDIADHYGLPDAFRKVADFRFLGSWGGSALTDPNMEIPKRDPELDRIPPTYVPFRNALFLSAAVGWAEILGAQRVSIGAVEEDGSGYPDCRKIFYDAFQEAVTAGTRPESRIEIHTPIISLTKKRIVLRGIELNAPLHLTWSCYENSDKACGACESCRLRLKGFEKAGRKDPIPYA